MNFRFFPDSCLIIAISKTMVLGLEIVIQIKQESKKVKKSDMFIHMRRDHGILSRTENA